MAFTKKIVEYVKNNYDLRNDVLNIIFPNKRAALFLRKELVAEIHDTVWLPNIMSVQEAFAEWSGLSLIDNDKIIFDILEIEMILNNKNTLDNGFFGLASQMLKDFNEIDSYKVDAKNLFGNLLNIKEIDAWSPDETNEIESGYIKFYESLYTYYIKLRDKLLSEKKGYYGMISRHLAELSVEELIDKAVKNKKVLFAGFNSLTRTEEEVIVRLVETGKAAILWDVDSYYYNDEMQEAGKLVREFSKRHPNIPVNFVSDNMTTEEKIINIIETSGATLQANALMVQLDKTKNENNTVVVLPDENMLIPVLNSIPDTYKSIHVTMGYPFNKTPVFNFILQLFNFHRRLSKTNDNIYLWSLSHILNLEFVKLVFNNTQLKKLSSWIEDLTSKNIFNVEKSSLNDLRDDKICKFIDLITKKYSNNIDFLENLKDILGFSLSLTKSEDYFLRNQIVTADKITNKMYNVLKKYDVIIQLVDLQLFFKQVSQETKLNLKGASDVLQIMGMLETRNIDFDNVHILDVNEGVIPQSKSYSSLIPFNLKMAFNMPTYKNIQAVNAYNFFHLFHNAKNINLYYNSSTQGVKQGEASRFLKQIKTEYAKNKNVKIEEFLFTTAEVPQINQENSIEIIKNDEILSKIMNKCSKEGLTPSSISIYRNCPLQFYFKYVYIDEKTVNTLDEVIQSNVIGNIVHDTLDIFYDALKGENGTITIDSFKKNREKLINESFKKSLEKNNFNQGLPNNGFNYLIGKVINRILESFLNAEEKFLEKHGSITILGLEGKLEYNFKYNNENIKLSGRYDRMDKVGDNIRVIDYKTGKVDESDLNIGKKDFADISDKAMQLLIYKYLYIKNNVDVMPNNVTAGIFGMQRLSKGLFELKIDTGIHPDKSFVNECETVFNELFTELFDRAKPFSKTEDISHCTYCDFKVICKR